MSNWSPDDHDWDLSGAMIGATKSGWADEKVILEWFERLFLPAALPRRVNNKPIVLIWDNFSAHRPQDLLESADRNHIDLLFSPLSATHLLQPLDVGVFGPFESIWKEHIGDLNESSSRVTKWSFFDRFMKARSKVVDDRTIGVKAFRKTGIYPINKTVITPQMMNLSAGSPPPSPYFDHPMLAVAEAAPAPPPPDAPATPPLAAAPVFPSILRRPARLDITLAKGDKLPHSWPTERQLSHARFEGAQGDLLDNAAHLQGLVRRYAAEKRLETARAHTAERRCAESTKAAARSGGKGNKNVAPKAETSGTFISSRAEAQPLPLVPESKGRARNNIPKTKAARPKSKPTLKKQLPSPAAAPAPAPLAPARPLAGPPQADADIAAYNVQQGL